MAPVRRARAGALDERAEPFRGRETDPGRRPDLLSLVWAQPGERRRTGAWLRPPAGVAAHRSAGGRNGTVSLGLELAGEALSPDWPHRFRAVHRIEVGASLRMSLEVRNDGAEPFTFEEALHTYIGVSDIRQVTLTGLAGCDYLDKMSAGERRRQGEDPIRFTAETDRVYLDTQAACVIHDAGLRRRIQVSKEESDATVVWNPWIAKARAMADFGDDEWPGMLCVETANVGVHARILQPGAAHTMTAALDTRDLQG